MPEPAATPDAAPAAAQSDFAQNAALIQQITAEAREAGKTLYFDPEAPLDAPDAEPSDAPGDEPPPTKPARKKVPPNDKEPEAPEDAEADAEEPAAETGEVGDVDAEAVKAALKAEGGVDMLALARALGVDPEALKVSPATHAALRIQKRKADAMIKKATELGVKLNQQYGDQVAARRAAEEGKLEPAIEYIENTFGMSWNDLNKMVVALLQGKPVADIDGKRELRELKKKDAERQAAEKKAADERVTQQKVTDAKAWISTSIKGDKLATPALNKQLEEAGFPTITDLVFEEMQANYARGLTDPKKALERVKLKLTKQARALQEAGLINKPSTPKPKTTTSATPRANAQTGAAGNGRPMTDAELRQAVLKEAGLLR